MYMIKLKNKANGNEYEAIKVKNYKEAENFIREFYKYPISEIKNNNTIEIYGMTSEHCIDIINVNDDYLIRNTSTLPTYDICPEEVILENFEIIISN